MLLFAVHMQAQQPFAGTVIYSMKSKDIEKDLSMSTNGRKTRITMSTGMGEADIVIDNANRQQMVIMHAQKMYMQMNSAMIGRIKGMMAQAGMPDAPTLGEPRHTGKTKKILGYICELLEEKNESGSTEIWVTDKLGSFGFAGSPIIPLPIMGNSDAATFFPLEIISRNEKGEEILHLEATKLDEKAPAESSFMPPPDYQTFSMPGAGSDR